LERWLLRRLLNTLGDPPVKVVLWTGEEVWGGDPVPEAVGCVRIGSRRALHRLIRNPDFYFAEEYSEGDIEVHGELVATLSALCQRLPASESLRPHPATRLRRQPHGVSRSRDNAQHHYDLGNDFYRLWLDEHLQYTCAYFSPPEASLEQAQLTKMDHVCRKLQLKPGQRVIEAGCGWGTFALHMARHYGVTVEAYNVSHEQILFARGAAREAGLAERVEFREDDWRAIRGSCDVFVSIGMLEHVGVVNYPSLGDIVTACLSPEGLGLIHSITRNHAADLNQWIDRRIFPGAQPPSLSELAGVFEPHEFSVLDVENLRLHYARTLQHWLDRFTRHEQEVESQFDQRFVRMWRIYLALSQVAFQLGWLQLMQVLFAPGRSNRVPWTREYQYVTTPDETRRDSL
jgi:cyclopropane-fatty-acyl-phospholipid synthase